MFSKKRHLIRVKAYRSLYKSGGFKKIRRIKNKFEKVKFFNEDESTIINLDLVTRQYFLNLFGNIRLEKVILYSIGSKSSIKFYPLHYQYASILKSEGIKVSYFWTTLSFWILIFGLWFRSFLKLVKTTIIFLVVKNKKITEPYIYFDGLNIKNLPNQNNNKKSFDVITWYIDKFKPVTKIIGHNVKIKNKLKYNGYEIKYISDKLPIPKNKLLLFFSSLGLLFIYFIKIITGKWQFGLLSNELIEANRLNYINKNELAIKYLFPNSGTFYRPIWTYYAEDFGSEIISYFYSTFTNIKHPKYNDEGQAFFGLMSWPNYFVWDAHQKKMMSKYVFEKSKLHIVGPINFSGTDCGTLNKNKIKIAIFDSPPFNMKTTFGFSTSNEIGLNEANIHISFINEIIGYTKDSNINFFLKDKRIRDPKLEVQEYKKSLSKLNRSIKNLIILNGDISAASLIENCDIVISFPFTSTSVIGHHLNKPSCYYDPTGKLSKKDKARHNLPLLSNKIELYNWVSKNIIELEKK